MNMAMPENAAIIKNNVRQLAQEIRQRDLSTEFDALRKLPEDVVEQLRSAGVFRMNMPKIWGGPELTPMEQVEVIETLCWADASVGWCSFIWTDSGIYSGYLQDDVARKLYPDLDMAQSGWVYPAGIGNKVDGGYELSGRFMFGSGSNHCDRLAAGFMVAEDGVPIMDASGKPQWRVGIGKPEQFELLDTWYTMGLKGTGSTDYEAHSVFIPAEHTFAFSDKAPREGSIWKKPNHFLRKMSGVPLGVARDAIDRAIEVLESKTDRMTGQPYRDMEIKQQAIARAEGKLGAARAYVFEALTTEWEKLEADVPLTARERAAVMISRQQAFQMGREIAQMMFDLVGADSIYARNRFERLLRDMNTACQHVVAQEKTLQNPGGLLLGSEKAAADFML
jgi:alkylation response protein AidB-like acyl-CoA dehydrogenase